MGLMRFAAALTIVLVFLWTPVCADGDNELSLTAADRQAIQAIISAQLAAFKRDDGEEAFSYASPTIRKIFGTIANFMEMVRSSYSSVYRSEIVSFSDILDVRGEPVQRVHITGEDGRTMIAAYVMQRQPDGVWKINGVYMFKDQSKAT